MQLCEITCFCVLVTSWLCFHISVVRVVLSAHLLFHDQYWHGAIPVMLPIFVPVRFEAWGIFAGHVTKFCTDAFWSVVKYFQMFFFLFFSCARELFLLLFFFNSSSFFLGFFCEFWVGRQAPGRAKLRPSHKFSYFETWTNVTVLTLFFSRFYSLMPTVIQKADPAWITVLHTDR